MGTREIAKEFIESYFAVPAGFFDTAWDFVNTNYEKLSSLAFSKGTKALEGAMSFGGDEERGAVKAILIFADGFKEVDFEGDVSNIVSSVRNACSKYNAEARLTKEILEKVSSLENRIAKFMKPVEKGKSLPKGSAEVDTKGYVIYLATSTGIGTEMSDISEKMIREDYLSKKNNYPIFIYTRNVFVKIGKELKSIQMDERIYKLLVIFLRQKDLLIPPIPLYRKAWAGSFYEFPSIRDERDVSGPLKSAISELRAILKDVQNFEITKARFEGYICKGKFQFCVIILKTEEKKFILSDAQDPE